MALSQTKAGGDVADINVQEAVPVHVAEIAPHALKRIAAQHARLRIGEPPVAFQDSKFKLARR